MISGPIRLVLVAAVAALLLVGISAGAAQASHDSIVRIGLDVETGDTDGGGPDIANSALAIGRTQPCNTTTTLQRAPATPNQISVDVVIEDIADLNGFDFFLIWNADHVDYVSRTITSLMLGATGGTALDLSDAAPTYGFGTSGTKYARMHFAGANLSTNTAQLSDGDGVLVRVTFQAINTGTVNLDQVFSVFQKASATYAVSPKLASEFPDINGSGLFPNKATEGYLATARGESGTVQYGVEPTYSAPTHYSGFTSSATIRRARLAVSPAVCPLIVDSAGDSGDASPGDGKCDDGTWSCTLRAAMQESNATTAADNIHFEIGSGAVIISPASPLPAITSPVTIDGRTQRDFCCLPQITVDGASAGAGAHGFQLNAGSSTVVGLEIRNFDGDGVRIDSSDNTIGKGVYGNTIYGNGGNGVNVLSGTGNAIRRNMIHSNGGLGIDLNDDGVTPDDPLDPDTGPNDLQNHGALASALRTSGGYTVIAGWSRFPEANKVFVVDLFLSPSCDPSGFGEGVELVDTAIVVTDAQGYVQAAGRFFGTWPLRNAPHPVGYFVTTTVTAYPEMNTSEFGNCVQILADTDGDGIEDSIDGLSGTSSGTFSNAFNDGAGNYGTVDNRGTLNLSIVPSSDASVCALISASNCVLVAGASSGGPCYDWPCPPPAGSPATISRCGAGSVTIPPAGLVVEACGSVKTRVLYGPVANRFGTIKADLPSGNGATVTDLGGGDFQITADADNTAPITVGGYGLSPGETAQVADPDGDGIVGQVDGCPDTATPWRTPFGDDDCDGFTNALELLMGTDPNVACGAGAWPPDFNDDRLINVVDLLEIPPFLGQSGSGIRQDLNGDLLVNVVDILEIPPFLGATC